MTELPEIVGVHDTELVSDWETLTRLRRDYGLGEDRWIFRGQKLARLPLRSTFERACEGAGTDEPWKYEAAMLRDFTRRAHHYVRDVPQPENTLEWFALMRHYGAPTRLLDCTYSFYVALHFAMHDAGPDTGPAAVWCLNTSWLAAEYERAFPEHVPDGLHTFRFKDNRRFRKHFLSRTQPRRFVAPANPFRLNERLTAQQGVFLVPGDISAPFMDNLFSRPPTADRERVVRVVLSDSMKTQVIRELRRMNISSATLFPDLGGFASSLADWFHYPLNFFPGDLEAVIQGQYPEDRY